MTEVIQMKFIPLIGDLHNLISQVLKSEDDRLFIYRQEMMFGYRLKAGYMSYIHICSELDICCGALQKDYDYMLKRISRIIAANPKSEPFKGIPPTSLIKPYFNDDQFCDHIESLYQKAIALPMAD